MKMTETNLRRLIRETLISEGRKRIQRMLKLDPWTFDQDKSLGWLSLPPDQQIDAMRRYIEGPLKSGQHPEIPKGKYFDLYTLPWHLGQALAIRDQPGDKDEAIDWMEKSRDTSDTQWNSYVNATIAFLNNDIASFEKHSEDENYNKDILDRLRKGWGRPYKEAY